MKNPPEFLIYRSSAGSGKTQTLAKEYLRLVLSGRSDFRHVLAVTFTNKASEEMKERVLRLLRAFADEGSMQPYHRKLAEEIAAGAGKPLKEICEKAAKVHRNILHQYSDFNIGTIDSFMHRIIRSFALELNLSYAFEVQLETKQFIATAVDDLLLKAGDDPELTRCLVGFTHSMLEDEKSWNIAAAIQAFALFLTSEVSISPMERIASMDQSVLVAVAETNREAIRKSQEPWIALLLKADTMVKATRIPPEEFAQGAKNGLALFFEKRLKDQDFGKIYNRYLTAKYMVGWLEEGKSLSSGKTSAGNVPVLQQLAENLIPVWLQLTQLIDTGFPMMMTRLLMQEQLANLSLGRKIREQMQATMDRENQIPIYEFNRLIWNIIRHQPVPFIYERTSERYDHFLVDEFQDTSALQWLNLLPLIENALSQGGMGMVVGDAKQAIYRWRNGDVWQFVRLPEIDGADENPLLKSRQEALKRYAQIRKLQHNYRSSEEIITFNNRFFGWLKERFPAMLQQVFDDHAQNAGGTPSAGYVEIHLIEQSPGDKVADLDRYVSDAVLAKVQETLHDLEGAILPSEICVLVRKNNEAGIIAAKLMGAGIDVVSGQSFTLGSYPESLVIRAMAALMVDPSDQVMSAALAVHLYRTGKISAGVLHEMMTQLPGAKAAQVSPVPWTDRLFKAAGLTASFAGYSALPLYDMCEQVIRDFFGSSANGAAVQYLLDLSHTFLLASGNDPAAFITFLDEKLGTSIPLTETPNAVNILTIHKAKGLQFRVVIYAFACDTPKAANNRKNLLWVENEFPEEFGGLPVLLLPNRENLTKTPFAAAWVKEQTALFQDVANIAYVAMTRAVERLYIVSAPKGRFKNDDLHLNGLLETFAKEEGLMAQSEGCQWCFGSKNYSKASAGSIHQQNLKMPGWSSYPWHDRLGIRSNHLKAWDSTPRSAAIDRGVLMHNILAAIRSAAEVQEVTMGFVQQGLIRKDELSSWVQELQELITMPEVAPFFAPSANHRSESTLITAEGALLRPDRVVFRPDSVAVLDFKTGKPHPSHHHQVSAYCSMLQKMGYSPVKGYLLYTGDRKLVEV